MEFQDLGERLGAGSSRKIRRCALEQVIQLVDAADEEELLLICASLRQQSIVPLLAELLSDAELYVDTMLVLGNLVADTVDPKAYLTRSELRRTNAVDRITPHLWSASYEPLLYALSVLMHICGDAAYVSMLKAPRTMIRLQAIIEQGDSLLVDFASKCLQGLRKVSQVVIAIELQRMARGLACRKRFWDQVQQKRTECARADEPKLSSHPSERHPVPIMILPPEGSFGLTNAGMGRRDMRPAKRPVVFASPSGFEVGVIEAYLRKRATEITVASPTTPGLIGFHSTGRVRDPHLRGSSSMPTVLVEQRKMKLGQHSRSALPPIAVGEEQVGSNVVLPAVRVATTSLSRAARLFDPNGKVPVAPRRLHPEPKTLARPPRIVHAASYKILTGDPSPFRWTSARLPVDDRGFLVFPECTTSTLLRRPLGLRRPRHTSFPELKITDMTIAHATHFRNASEVTSSFDVPRRRQKETEFLLRKLQKIERKPGASVVEHLGSILDRKNDPALQKITAAGLFRAFDADCDGQIGRHELTETLAALGYAITDEDEVRELVVKLGGDVDTGSIVYEAFKQALSGECGKRDPRRRNLGRQENELGYTTRLRVQAVTRRAP